ncbi:molybdopterin-dependent oxidoreductase [Brevibacillus humidisoli]|uniref:molybdopterin-dependent oxidoreductase n=1 Tax=Brevibacillus humidisoli TaxID=2895522 RepID=UPI001E5EDD9D|nr:molybdopterin-dependent oxidoreductase [Brevibacillus humidisoli]UFJ39873.1 molybdopterin-dependent oxidoreductase [Brevibacillus humidisoli]
MDTAKKLKTLHYWNAWTILLLAVTGILLYLPSLRGSTALVRVSLKQLHIGLGIVSLLLLLAYLPLFWKHVKQIAGSLNQVINLAAVLLFVLGWGISGIVLWQIEWFPGANAAALIWHDVLTWIGVPWAVYHSISRSRWVKRADRGRLSVPVVPTPAAATPLVGSSQERNRPVPWYRKPPVSRRSFVRMSIGSLLVLLIGPAFYRWLKTVTDDGGASLDAIAEGEAGKAARSIQPLPQSNPPIGGGAQGHFRVYTVTDIPSFAPNQWSFSVSGLVDKPFTLTWDQFLQLPRTVQVSDFHCVTGWSVYQITWEGIPLRQLLEPSGVRVQAKYVKLYSGDGIYTDCLSLEQARLDDVMAAVLLDGKPIPEKLGGPVRLVVPQMYAYKSVKWLQAVELIDTEHLGYWEVRGYDTDAWLPNLHQKRGS